jgi:hypothetical protein
MRAKPVNYSSLPPLLHALVFDRIEDFFDQKVGNPARMAMMAMTTSISIKVNSRLDGRDHAGQHWR